MFQLNPGDPLRVVIEIAGVGAVIWGVLHQDRKERKRETAIAEEKRRAEFEQFEQVQTQRHEENREIINDLATRLEYHPPHAHLESDGQPLTSRGIQYGPRKRLWDRDREK